MASNPYIGLNSTELAKIKAHCLAILTGTSFQQSGAQGSNYTRFRWTVDEARQNLALVNAAIAALDPTTKPVSRTQISHATYQDK